MRRMLWTIGFFGLCGALVSGTARGEASRAFDPSRSDPKAIALADRTMEAMGGADAWASVAYLSFDFVVGKNVFHHAWDRRDGLYRDSWIEPPPPKGTTPPYPNLAGKKIETIFHLGTQKGVALVDGKQVKDPKMAQYLISRESPRGGYSRFVNDSYWLLMPYKLKDAGVHLHTAGEAKGPDGQVWDVIRVTFDPGVGLTPKDQWWAYINRKTGLMDRWGMILQGQKGPPKLVDWTGWKKFGPIMLATDRKFVKGPGSLKFEHIVVSKQVPKGVFDALR